MRKFEKMLERALREIKERLGKNRKIFERRLYGTNLLKLKDRALIFLWLGMV